MEVKFHGGAYYCAVFTESRPGIFGAKEDVLCGQEHVKKSGILIPDNITNTARNGRISVHVDVDKGNAFLNYEYPEIIQTSGGVDRADPVKVLKVWASAGFPTRWEINPHKKH